MNAQLPKASERLYVGCDAYEAARIALGPLRVRCPQPAPCLTHCPQGADVSRVMRWAGQAACEALSLSRWLWSEDRLEAARAADQICASYN